MTSGSSVAEAGGGHLLLRAEPRLILPAEPGVANGGTPRPGPYGFSPTPRTLAGQMTRSGTGLHTTLHLWRVPGPGVPGALLRMGLDRLALRSAEGLTFAKLLGTGDGRTFRPVDADPMLWGLLAVWRDGGCADRFEGHRTPRGWRRLATHESRLDLRCLRTRGRWSRQEPFAVDRDLAATWDGPVASVTRARIRPSLSARFWGAVPPVVDDLDRPLVRIGIGEAPLGLQGTFTVWPDVDALTDFAYRRSPHRAAITATQETGWYAEELFARFAVVGSRGPSADMITTSRRDADALPRAADA